MAQQITPFFRDALDAYLQASETPSFRKQLVRMAGRNVKFQYADDFAPSQVFSHLPMGDRHAGMTVCSWTGGRDLRPEGLKPNEVLNLVSDRYRAVFDRHMLSAFDRHLDMGLFWSPDAKSITATERSTPYRNILHWWASDNGMQLTHAAAVGRSEGGALLIGRGGSGKSTTALACLAAGMGYASDDYCLVGTKDGAHHAWSAYNTGKLVDGGLVMLPQLASSVVDRDPVTGKNILALQRRFSYRLLQGFPIKALILPRVIPADRCEARPLSKAAALAALAPSTIFQLPRVETTFPILSKLVAEVPCYELAVGIDIRRAPEVVDRCIR